jgi:hypothetical protein
MKLKFKFKFKQIFSFIQICPVGAEFFHEDGETDGQTDGHDEANSRFFRNHANAPKNGTFTPALGTP